MKDTCPLWTKTADLTKDYGHELAPSCPVISACPETRCIFIDSITKLSQEDAINTESKLIALREELEKRKNIKVVDN